MVPAVSPPRPLRLPRHLPAWAGASLLLLMILAACCAPVFWHGDPLMQLTDGLSDLGTPLAPSSAHPLGTDELGRDVLARWLYGARVSLGVGFAATALAGLIGGVVGILAGYFRGWVDLALMRVTEVVMAFPTLLLAIGLAAVLPPSVGMVILTLGLVGWTAIARLVRAATLAVREAEYLEAARAQGAHDLWILTRHVLPNVAPTLVSLLTLKLADMFLLEAALSFLGLGVRPPTPSWGNMIHDGQLYFRDAPWLLVAPGLAIVAVVLAANLVGDRFSKREG